LFQAEPDPSKRDLLGQQISFFESKIYQQQPLQHLQQQQQQQQQQQPHYLPPPAGSLTSPPVVVEDHGTQLCREADRAYKEAVRLDTGPSGSPNSPAEALYLQAAELFMQASKLCTLPTQASRDQHKALSATVSSILDRIAQLRGQNKQGPQGGGGAAGNYTTSDDDAMFLAEFDNLLPTIDPTRPLVLKGDNRKIASATTSLPLSLPTSSQTPAASGSSSFRPQSQSSGDLTSAEITILRRSSFINGRCFLPWMDDDKTEKFKYPPGKLFTDPDGFLPLSASQTSKQARYKRIHEIVAASSPPGKKVEPVLIKAVSPLAITQVHGILLISCMCCVFY
jgi:hypothetical protein